MRRIVCGVAAAAMLLTAASAEARCLRYEPAKVVLSGTLKSRSVPGPPGYASVARGDHPETIYLLELMKAVCVSGDPGTRLNATSHAGVETVQLAGPKAHAKAWVGKKVRATGSLFGAHSGHHRTPVVLNVKSLAAY